jgi:hypothetical protein
MSRRLQFSGRLRRHSNVRPPTSALVTRLLRDAYTAPDDPAFWDRLEARIMAKVHQPAPLWAATGWAAAFRSWGRAGLAAACAAAIAAGIAAWTSRNTEARVAYESVLDREYAVPVLADSRFINVSEQEATARYVLSH